MAKREAAERRVQRSAAAKVVPVAKRRPIRVVFLDVDGVLNSVAYSKSGRRRGPKHARNIDRLAVAHLNTIVDATNAVVVISSVWRLLHSLPKLRSYLRQRGFRGRIIGRTEEFPSDTRGAEIAEWLRICGRPVQSYVALDDDGEFEPIQHRLVQTSYKRGLLARHVRLAIAMLRQPLSPYAERWWMMPLPKDEPSTP